MSTLQIAPDHLRIFSISCPQLTALNNLNVLNSETRFAREEVDNAKDFSSVINKLHTLYNYNSVPLHISFRHKLGLGMKNSVFFLNILMGTFWPLLEFEMDK